MKVAAGSDIQAKCNKCGEVWHVIVAMVGDKIAKVQCKECMAYHRYRAPGDAKKAPKAATTRRKTAGARAVKKDAPPPGPMVEADLSKPTQPYSAVKTFPVGQRIEHPKFGTGIVEVSTSGKVQVFFTVGRKTLAQARETTAKLSRPRPFDH
jgi:hypothetical protein